MTLRALKSDLSWPSFLMRPLITLTTDFGVSSPYVAQMKGEILRRNREAEIVDITHAIGPQNVVEGAIVLDDVTRRFPAGTVHVAVVDPGVGTSRRIVYAEIGDQKYLAAIPGGNGSRGGGRPRRGNFTPNRLRGDWRSKVSRAG